MATAAAVRAVTSDQHDRSVRRGSRRTCSDRASVLDGPASGPTRTVPPGAGPVLAPGVRAMLGRADRELALARNAATPAERFLHAHLAALRLAGAVLDALDVRAPRGRPRSAWERVAAAAPDLASYAACFASGASTRSAVETGRGNDVDGALAAAWESTAERFRGEVVDLLGGDLDGSLPGRTAAS